MILHLVHIQTHHDNLTLSYMLIFAIIFLYIICGMLLIARSKPGNLISVLHYRACDRIHERFYSVNSCKAALWLHSYP